MRDYTYLDQYLDKLGGDIYGQPPDGSHTAWAIHALDALLPENVGTVLDVGCGHGFLAPIFSGRGILWSGVTLGSDVLACRAAGLDVKEADASFLPFENESFDLVFARHMLEHSPFPILTLMEWRRVSRGYLLLIAPAPDYWTYRGKNHYSMAPKEQLVWWLDRAGWKIMNEDIFDNSNTLFLDYWRTDLMKAGLLDGKNAPTHFPKESKIVEYRFLCVRSKEITT